MKTITTTYATRNARNSIETSVSVDSHVSSSNGSSPYVSAIDLFTGMPKTEQEIMDMQRTRQRINERMSNRYDIYG